MDPKALENESAKTADSTPEVSNELGVKRTASHTRSRGIASLNAEKLERKRAHDREAQRLMRQRTRDYIERLENRMRELTEGQVGNLEELQQRNDELERELRRLQESLRLTEEGMVGSDFAVSIDPSTSTAVARSVHGSSSMNAEAMGTLPAGPIPVSYPSSSGSGWSSDFPNSLVSSTSGSSGSDLFSAGYGQMDTMGAGWTTLPTEMGIRHNVPLEQMGRSIPIHGRGAGRGWVPHSIPIDPSRMNQVPSIGSSTMINRLFLTNTLPRVPRSLSLPICQVWELPLRLLPPTGPLDHLLIGIVERQRSLAAAGASITEVIGPYHPSLRILVDPNQTEDSHPISTILCNLLHRTPVNGLPEKAACLFGMYPLARWQIAPSLETYSALPEWLTPQASQLLTPHPVWVSTIPNGKLRDKVIVNQEKYATGEFQTLFAVSVRINWPKRPIDLLVYEGGEVTFSEEFIRHCSILANWSFGEPFSRRYPELADVCRLTTSGVQEAYNRAQQQF